MRILACLFIALAAAAPAPSYALIGAGGVKLYSAQGELITSLPATYFVTVMDEDEQKYHVSYLDIDGYIFKDEAALSIVDYEPVTKYGQPAFVASNDTHPVNLRASPSGQGTIIAAIPDAGRGIYYGKVEGEALIAEIKDWFYVRYYDNGSYLYGYVYAPQITADKLNDNVIEKVERPKEPSGGDKPTVMSSAMEGIFIAALCIPAVIVMFVIFRAGSKRDPRHSN